MAKVFLLHWHESELEERAKPLRTAGHVVRGQWSSEVFGKWGDWVPDACVISLDRLPSHGRQAVEWIWEAKKRRTIPVLFAGGAPDKAAQARKQFPGAAWCPTDEIAGTLARMLRGEVKAVPLEAPRASSARRTAR
jgi:hypothetical protein